MARPVSSLTSAGIERGDGGFGALGRRPQMAFPPSAHRRNVSTRSESQGASQGIDPLSSTLRIAAAFLLTSSYDHRSKSEVIAPLSRSRKRGLTSRSKLTDSADIVRLLVWDWVVQFAVDHAVNRPARSTRSVTSAPPPGEPDGGLTGTRFF